MLNSFLEDDNFYYYDVYWFIGLCKTIFLEDVNFFLKEINWLLER